MNRHDERILKDFRKELVRQVYAADLPWQRWPWERRCKAVKEPGCWYWGRCELRRNHEGDHALERGMEVARWSTRWTQ